MRRPLAGYRSRTAVSTVVARCRRSSARQPRRSGGTSRRALPWAHGPSAQRRARAAGAPVGRDPRARRAVAVRRRLGARRRRHPAVARRPRRPDPPALRVHRAHGRGDRPAPDAATAAHRRAPGRRRPDHPPLHRGDPAGLAPAGDRARAGARGPRARAAAAPPRRLAAGADRRRPRGARAAARRTRRQRRPARVGRVLGRPDARAPHDGGVLHRGGAVPRARRRAARQRRRRRRARLRPPSGRDGRAPCSST